MVTTFAAAQHDSGHMPAPWLALSEGWVGSVHEVSRQMLHWPFDALRDQYATAVRAGLIERSLIASSQFERKTAALEQTLLGRYARQV